MRILFYEKVEKRPSGKFGGSHIFELLNNLSRLGHSIVWVDGQTYSPVEEFDIGLDLKQRQSLWERIKAFVMTLPLRGEARLLWNLVKEVRLSFLAFAAMRRHKPDVIYRRHTLFNGECVPAKLLRVPFIQEVNGIVADEVKVSGRASALSLRTIDRIEGLSLRRADRVVVVTSKLKEYLCNHHRIPEDNIVVIENGANTDLFRPIHTVQARRELGLSQGNNYVCFVGMLWQVQGVEYLIKAMPPILEECPNTQLLIIGDGPMKQGLVKIAEQAGVSSNVLFEGVVLYQRVPLYVSASDVCVAPKLPTGRGYSPLKLYEYMACGKPVVATRTSGFDILEENNAGLLVNPKNSQEFADAITKLLKNPEIRKRMGDNGRKYVVQNRSWQSVARKVTEVCEQVVEEHKRNQMGRKP